MNMQKLMLIQALFLSFFGTTYTKEAQSINQLSQPNKPLSKYQALKRDFWDFILLENLGYKGVVPETENYLRQLIKEMGMEDYNIEIRSMSNHIKRIAGRMNAFVVPSYVSSKSNLNLLFISEKWFSTLSEGEKRALIGHELTHIRRNHIPKRIILSMVSRILFYNILLNNIFNKPQQVSPESKILESEDQTMKNLSNPNNTLDKAKKTLLNPRNMLISTIAEGICFAGDKMLTSWFSRRCEKECDIEGANTLQCTDGAVALWERFIEAEDPESRFAFKRAVSKIMKVATYPLRKSFYFLFATHPNTKDRRDYMKELAEEQKQAIENSPVVAN